MERHFKPIKTFRLRSILVTIIALMVSLDILLCLIFSFFFMNTYIKITTQEQVQKNQVYLHAIVSNVDYLFHENLHQSLLQLSNTNSLLTLSYFRNYNEYYLSLAESDMVFTAENNSLVKTAILYLRSQNYIITSSHMEYKFDEYPNNQMISLYKDNQLNLIPINNNERTSSLFYYSGNYYMALDYPFSGTKGLATIFYLIDIHALYRYLVNDFSDSAKIWVYDSSNNPVFQNNVTYPADITSDVLGTIESSKNKYSTINKKMIFINTSSVTGWKFLYVIDQSSIRPTLQTIIAALAPILISLLIFIPMIVIFIAPKLYKPLRRLMDSIESNNLALEALPSSKNELDYINSAIVEAADYLSNMQVMMHNVSYDVIARLFLDLLSGIQISQANVNNILKNVGSSFESDNNYIVCLLQYTEGLSLDERVKLVISSELKSIVFEFDQKFGSLSYILMTDNKTFSVILSFKADITPLRTEILISDLKSIITEALRKHNITMRFSSGHLYHSILDLGFSYREALQALSKHEISCETEQTNSSGFNDTYFYTRAQQIYSLMFNNDINGAQTLSERVINHFLTSASDINEQLYFCEAFIAAFVFRIVKLEHIDLSSKLEDLPFYTYYRNKDLNPSVLEEAVKSSCSIILSELAIMLEKQKNPHIISAREYIAKHYDDVNLSLNSTAAAIGITPTYLSRLFKSNLGINFTDYLNHYRIDCSIHTLETSNIDIKDIADQFGFCSVQNYIRVFKKYTEKTPGQYRAAASNQGSDKKKQVLPK